MATPPVATDKTLKSTTKSVIEANASVEAAAQGTTDAVKTGVDATKKVVEGVGNVSEAVSNVATTIADSNKSLITAAGKTTTEIGKVTSGIEQTAISAQNAIDGLGKKIATPVTIANVGTITGATIEASARTQEVFKAAMAAEAAGKKFDIPPDVDAKELAAFAAQNVPTGETLKPHPELNILYNQITSQLKALAYEKTIGKLMGVIAPIGGTMDNLIKWKPSETLAKMGEGFLGKLNKFKGDEAAVSSQGEAAVSSQGEAAVSSQGEAAVSSQMEKALQKIGKGNVDLVNMTSAQRKSTLKNWDKQGKDTTELHKLLIGEGKEKEGKLDQAQLQAGAELVGEREQGDILTGRKDERIEYEVDVDVAKGEVKGEVKGEEKEGEKKGDTPVALNSMSLLGKMVESLEALQDIEANMLNLMVDDSADAAEAAKEAARAGMMKGDKGDVKDAKVQEAKAGGFFSRMGKAVMNPMKALGSGMSKIGKGIQGILTGIARGLMAFANPLVLVGVTFLAISLPILAAGLAAAFKVFDMIAGKGAAMEILTGIIESLGRAIGGILKNVLHGLGLFIGASGPFIEQFFLGISHLMKALAPIISALAPVIQTLITSFEKILTSEAFRDILIEIIDLVKLLVPLIEGLINGIVAAVTVLGNIIITIVNAIAAIIKTVGDVIIAVMENIGAIIESIGNAISGVIDSIGGVFKVVGDVIVAVIEAIGDAVVKVIDGIVSGIERLAAIDGSNLFTVALALGALAVSLVGFAAGAAVAGAFMPSKEELGALADSIAKFGKIPADNLAAVGEGMKALGIGLIAFGTGGALAALMSPGEGGLEKVAKNVEMFGKIPADNLAAVGVGMERLGVGLKEFAVGGFLASLLSDPKGLVNVAASVSKFGAIDATNFNMVGTGIQKIGEGLSSFAGGGFLSTLSEGFGSLIGASDPVEKFQKFAKIGPGLDVAAEGIKGLALAMKDFEATVKGLDLARVDEVAKGLAKIRDAQDPGALAAIGGMVSSVAGAATAIFSGDKKKGESTEAGEQSIPSMIAGTNELLKVGLSSGFGTEATNKLLADGLFGSPSIGESAFLMSTQQKQQITTAEEQLKTSKETKDEIKSPVKVGGRTGIAKKSLQPVLKEIVIPDTKPLKFEKVKKIDVPKFEDPTKKITRSKSVTEREGWETVTQVGDPRFKTPKQFREEKKLRKLKQAKKEFGGGTTYKQIPLEEGGGFKKDEIKSPVKVNPKIEDPQKNVRSTYKYKVPEVESFQTTKPPELKTDEHYQKGELNGTPGTWLYMDGGWYFSSDKKVTKKWRGKTGVASTPDAEKDEIKSPVKVNPKTGQIKIMAEDKKVDFEKLRKGFEKPILKTIEIPEPKPLKFEKVKMDVPKFEDPEKKVRSTYKVSAVESFQTTKPPELESNKLVQKGTHNGVSGKWTYLPQEGGYYFQSDKKVTKKLGGKTGVASTPDEEFAKQVVDEREESNKLRQAEKEFGGGTTYKQIPLEEGGGFKMVGRTRVPIEPLDASAIPPSYLTGVPTGQTLMAGQMESNALATAGASSPSITDASSSTIVNNSNQSLMMPTPDPNPHNMDFQPEHRLFPRV